jgi:hypothetical protein
MMKVLKENWIILSILVGVSILVVLSSSGAW